MSLKSEFQARQLTDDGSEGAERGESVVHSHRLERFVELYLSEREDPVRIGALARNVAAAESGTPVEALSTAQYRRVYTALYRTHLPRLDRASVLEYDRTRGLVYPTGILEHATAEAEPALGGAAGPATPPTDPELTTHPGARPAALGLAGLVLSGGVMSLSLAAGVMIGGLVIAAYLLSVIAAT